MSIIDIVLTLLGSVGMTFIITQSYLFRNIRSFTQSLNNEYLNKLFCCTACAGFWVGIVNTLGILFIPYYFVFMIGCITSLLSYSLWLLLKVLIERYDA